MTQDFYRSRLESRGIGVLIPGDEDIGIVNSVIYDELCRGIISDKSRKEYLRILDAMSGQGAEAAVLGCTEIGLLVRPGDTGVPLYDTTAIHATRAALLAPGLSDK